jgi:hypothetical protein
MGRMKKGMILVEGVGLYLLVLTEICTKSGSLKNMMVWAAAGSMIEVPHGLL